MAYYAPSGAAKRIGKSCFSGKATGLIRMNYEEVEQELIKSENGDNDCIEKGNRDVGSVVDLVQPFPDERTPGMKNTTLVSDCVHALLFYASDKRRKWSIDNGHTIVPLLTLRCSHDKLK